MIVLQASIIEMIVFEGRAAASFRSFKKVAMVRT